ncbi:helix-turn-helix transcriptional regulator [Thioflexithrix psekupsensis]|uniref:Helix-turn-helix transcriptional regulator n=1 Tax=Thioflexithrix psekupsensis TaxID=1570016 RepID=A0A251X9H3_9GAMM|nr:helix-turn-helix transcriptional regulator [Thioflexithrix psekupsensis]OUD14152.1 helix-turn-helix transcriptional regulator [Thioflexithrix psekupsensis]
MSQRKEKLFIIWLLIIVLLNFYEFYNDLSDYDHTLFHITIELVVILFSVFGIIFLMWEVWQRQREIEQLSQQLTLTRTHLDEVHQKVKQASRQYAGVIQEQFTSWELTQSEKEVAMLLLKGLSFEEIAQLRATKEKTVRQQATSIYRKSGLNGRYAFAAWFFEDFLG